MRKMAVALATIFGLYCMPVQAQSQDAGTTPEFAVSLPADCPLGKVQGSLARKAAGRWFAQGELLVAEEQYEEAVKAFLCSFKLVEHPNTLFNTAQAAMLLGNTELALEMLRRYMNEAPDGPMASDVKMRIAELEAQIKTRSASPSPPQEPGQPELAEPLPSPLPPPPLPRSPSPAKASWQRPVGIAALGLSGAVAVTGVVLHALAGVAQSNGQGTDELPVFEEQRDKMNGLQTGAIVCYGVAGVAAVAGILLLALDSPERPSESIAVRPAASGMGLAWEF